MREIQKTVVTFQCTKCNAEYQSPVEAENCERRKLEGPVFRVGERAHTDLKLWCRYCETGFEIVKVVIVFRNCLVASNDSPAPDLELALAPHSRHCHEYLYDINAFLSKNHYCTSSTGIERLHCVPGYKLKKVRTRTRKPARPLRRKK